MRPNELCKKFLNVKPRPTEKELCQAYKEQDRKKRRKFMQQIIDARTSKNHPEEYEKILRQTHRITERGNRVIENTEPAPEFPSVSKDRYGTK